MTLGTSSSNRPPRIAGLDGIRGLAALMVFVFHFFQAAAEKSDTVWLLARVTSPGQSGVDLFFVLSGFLITGILLENRGASGAFQTFCARRILRIFPVYYLALLVLIVAGKWSNGSFVVSREDAWWYVTYLQNVLWTFDPDVTGPNHFWSLAVEEQFYLVWPFLVFGLSARRLVQTCIGLVVMGVVCRAFFVANNWSTFYFTFCRLDGLVVGSILAIAFRYRELGHRLGGAGFRVAAIAVLLGMLLCFIVLGRGSGPFAVVKPLLLALLYGGVIAATILAGATSSIARVFSSSPLCATGKYSYAFYVAHPFVISSVGFQTGGLLGSFCLALAGTYAIAVGSWFVLEGPILALKDRLPTLSFGIRQRASSGAELST